MYFHFSNFRKPCSGYKLKEITGSGIFEDEKVNGASESASTDATLNSKTGLRIYQVCTDPTFCFQGSRVSLSSSSSS